MTTEEVILQLVAGSPAIALLGALAWKVARAEFREANLKIVKAIQLEGEKTRKAITGSAKETRQAIHQTAKETQTVIREEAKQSRDCTHNDGRETRDALRALDRSAA